jgi:hypothetical protein
MYLATLFFSENAIVAAVLPETLSELLSKMESRHAAERTRPLSNVCAFPASFHQQMKVIRHETVRNDFNVVTSRRTQ